MKPTQRGYIPSHEVPELPADQYDEYWVNEARQGEVEQQLQTVNTNLSGNISGYNLHVDRIVLPDGGLAFEEQTTTQPKLLKIDPNYITLTTSQIEIKKNIKLCVEFEHCGEKVGFFGATPATQSTGWSVTNLSEDKTLDADGALDQVADVLGSLIETLKNYGILG